MTARNINTVYAAALSRLGLSRSEAAALHGVRADTIKSWSMGRNRVPAGVWDDLRAREAEIRAASTACAETWREGEAYPTQIALDDLATADGFDLMGAADFVLRAGAEIISETPTR